MSEEGASVPVDVVLAISQQEWLQGDLVNSDKLRAHIPDSILETQFAGKEPTYWLLVSHSCTVHARRYDDAPFVEWLACKIIKKPFHQYLNALNPRTLQLQVGTGRYLELRIHRRVWTRRDILPSIVRAEEFSLDDEARKVLGYWLAHAYNRIAMPDALVERLKGEAGEEGIARKVDEFLSLNNQLLHSAWVSFQPKSELRHGEPYVVSFRFLVKPQYSRQQDELQNRLGSLVGLPRSLSDGLEFDGAEVTVLQDFTMLDAEDYVRYNLHDWLSLGEESDSGDE
ncbi:hypothetical protein [Stutzerimonas chloritidismutans]